MNPTRVRFLGKLIVASHKHGGSIESAESEAFVDALFSEWSSLNLPIESCSAWLVKRLENCFVSLSGPPQWVEPEPSWAFHNGFPMVFISQSTFTDDALCTDKLSPGETVYLFAARSPSQRGARMVYRVVSQCSDGGAVA